MLPITFRRLPPEGEPGEGELWVRDPKGRNKDALLMIERGPDAFPRGPGAVRGLVVDVSDIGPTLDEMLAAHLAALRLEGADVAPYAALARYAATVREGLIPTDQPRHVALENIYLAVRNQDGDDLSKPDVVERFLDGWGRMAARFAEAAAKREDPVRAALFADDPHFVRERTYLQEDEETYRQDVARGRAWLARIPGQLPRGAALLLREPRSLLFKAWARSDRRTLTGQPYQFLAVDWGNGVWVCSTNPARRLSLAALSKRLQQAERKAHPPADGNPWSDGKKFQHTLIAAPRGGSKLKPEAVEAVLREWTRVRGFPRRAALALGSGLALAALVWLVCSWPRPIPTPGPGPGPGPTPTPPSDRDRDWIADSDAWQGAEQAREIYSDEFTPKEGAREASFDIPKAESKAVLLRVRLKMAEKAAPPRVWVGVNGGAEKVASPVPGAGDSPAYEVRAQLPGGKDTEVRVRLDGDPAPKAESIGLSALETAGAAELHVLAVGVSKYEEKEKVGNLDFAAADAAAVAEEFKKADNLFSKVEVKYLPDDQAKRTDILNALTALRKEVEAAQQEGRKPNLAVVFFAGHGLNDKDLRDGFVFLPYDYRTESEDVAATGVSASELRQRLEAIPCTVVLILDTCHSGAFTTRSPWDSEKNKALEDLKQVKGMVVLTACGKDQASRESKGWGDGHGALTWALLQCLRGRPADPSRHVITLRDVYDGVQARVKEMYERKGLVQPSIVIDQSGGIPFDSIPLAEVGGEDDPK